MKCILRLISNNQKQFNDILLTSIDETLRNTLGNFSKEIIQQQLIRNHSVEWRKIPQNLHIFNSTLSELFGASHFIIKDLILENVCNKLDFVVESKIGYTFLDYIQKLRKKGEFQSLKKT